MNWLKNNKFLFCILLLIFCYLSYCSLIIFKNFPVTADEHHYYMQAYQFLRGKVYYDLDLSYDWATTHTVQINNKLTSPYQPGFSIILAIGLLFKVEGLVNPFLATLSLLCLYYLVRSFTTHKVGIISIFLAASNPYFLGYSCSYFAQTLSSLLVILTLLLIRNYDINKNLKFIYLAGACSGYLFLTRQLDGTCLALFLVFYSLINKPRKLQDWYWLPLFICGVLGLLLFNWFGFGKIGVSLGKFYNLFPLEFIFSELPISGIKYLEWYFGQIYSRFYHVYWNSTIKYSAFLLPAFAFVGIYYSNLDIKWRIRAIVLSALFIFSYNAAPFHGWPIYGARYTYPLFLLFVFLATFALNRLPKLLFSTVFSITLFWQIYHLQSKIIEYKRRFELVELIWHDLKEKCPDKSAITLITPVRLAKDHFFETNELLRTGDSDGRIPYNKFIGNNRYLLSLFETMNLNKSPNPDFQTCAYPPINLYNNSLKYDYFKEFTDKTVSKTEDELLFVKSYEKFDYPTR